jgi:hypothetical protein
MRVRFLAVVTLAPLAAACSQIDLSDTKVMPNFGGLAKFESLSVASAAPNRALRPVTQADLVGPQGQCAGTGGDAAQGGIALEMTECEVVKRAGPPENVEVGTNERGERAVTLTYNSGPRPGIYHFAGGRLYDIDRVEAPPPPPDAKAKKPAPKKPKSA